MHFMVDSMIHVMVDLIMYLKNKLGGEYDGAFKGVLDG